MRHIIVIDDENNGRKATLFNQHSSNGLVGKGVSIVAALEDLLSKLYENDKRMAMLAEIDSTE
jgi:hypothetical protein